MRIVYVVPGTMDEKEMARRGGLLREWAAPGVQVDITGVTEGPASIESMYEEYLSIPATAKKIFELEQEGYDAAILGCAGDPGLDAMREITSKMLVVGPAEASFVVAAMLGYRFSLLTVMDSMIPSSYELVHKAGVAAKLASVRAVNVPVLELACNRHATLEKIIAVGRRAIEEDGAHVLVLGCMSMGFLNVAEDIQAALGVPVVNPSKVALKVTEALVGSNLRHSKKAFALPPKLAEGKVGSIDDLYVRL
ncbi:MAG: aspartate/glutamate racemase family protein [Betaproteobacteria bacterium]